MLSNPERKLKFRRKMRINRRHPIFKAGVIVLVFAWIFSGWPQIWNHPNFPPKPQEAHASVGDVGEWRDSSSQVPGTSFGALEFDTEIRNDGIYTRPDDSTIELDEAGNYLIVSSLFSYSTSRQSIQSQVALTSGTGTLFTSNYSGYSSGSPEVYATTRAVGVLIGASADAQIELQARYVGTAPTTGTLALYSRVQVIRIDPDNWGIYDIGSSSQGLGGTTPNTVDLTAVTLESSTSAIEGNTGTDTVTVKGNNKHYLVAWSVASVAKFSRTQRIGHLEYDGTDDLATNGYCYQRQSFCGLGSMDIIETSTADRAIQVEVYRGDGVSNDDGGATANGGFVTDGNGQMVVLELPDSMDVFRSHDATGLQDLTDSSKAAALNAMRNVDFNDSGSFTQASNALMNVVNSGDVFAWSNVWAARHDVTSTKRLTAYGYMNVGGSFQYPGFASNYSRGEAGSQDTFGFGYNAGGIYAVSSDGDDIGVASQGAAGTAGGGEDRTQAGTVGFFALNLDAPANNPPSAPTQYDVPFDNEKTEDTTPDFEFEAGDPDGSADITYQIQIDDTYAFSSAVVDCESDTSCSTGAGSFTNTESSDTDPFNEDEKIRFTPTTTLSSGTTYYWRVRAEDNSGSGGSGGYGAWSNIHSFTVQSSTDPSQWFQTTDEQFDTDTLVDTGTTSDSVQFTGSSGGATLDVLLICGTSACNNANEDTALLNYIETTLGHNVTKADTTEVSTSAYDVVVVSSSISSSLVSWLKDDATPVLTLEGANYDEFDLGTGGATMGTTDTDFDIQDNSHYITVEQTTGDLTVSSSTTHNGYFSGWANDVQALAVSSASSSEGRIVIADSGDTLADSSTAAERRAFFGASYFADLNSAGEDLFTRTLDWTAYNAASDPGTIMSSAIDYDWMTDADSWDEFDWSEDETNGTVSMQLYYTSSTTCDTVVPNAALSGNESGFSSGPIDISGLNTTTYNEVCLKATLTDSGGTPYLEDWTVSWVVDAGTLTTDIVDSGGSPVASPSMSMSSVGFDFSSQVATGTFGTSSEKLRVSNTTSDAQWSLTIAATDGISSLWESSGGPSYDFNDPSGAQMTIDAATNGTITPQGGCTSTGLTLGSSASFSQGVTDTISLLTAGASADTDCYWDLTDIDISQSIPAEQPAESDYNLDMTITITAS